MATKKDLGGIFTPKIGEDDQFDENFSHGLKRRTSIVICGDA